jgi:hypothetical protein
MIRDTFRGKEILLMMPLETLCSSIEEGKVQSTFYSRTVKRYKMDT